MPETPKDAASQTSAPVTSTPTSDLAPAPKPAIKAATKTGSHPKDLKDLTEEYALPDHEFDAELDSVSAPAKKKEAPAQQVVETAPKVETPQKPAHDAALVAMALDLGISQEEIDELPARGLAVTVRNMTRLAMSQVKQAPEKPAEPPKEEEEAIDWGIDPETGLAIKDEDLNPGIVRSFKAERKARKEMEKKLDLIVNDARARAQMSVAQTVDEIFAKSPKTFGTGSAQTIKQDSAEYARRNAAWTEAKRIAGPNPSQAQFLAALPKAIENLFGAQQAAPLAKDELDTEIHKKRNGQSRISTQQWEDATLASPTQRVVEEPKGPNRATKKVAEKLREMGQSIDEEFEGIEESGLPD